MNKLKELFFLLVGVVIKLQVVLKKSGVMTENIDNGILLTD